jgi:hypothetical protein
MAERSHLIFISYRGSDQNWATELVYARMTEAFGADAVFKAGNTLRAGEEFPAILRRQAASCPVMLVCIGPGWLTALAPDGSRRLDSPDDWVREEIAISLQAGNHVVPLLIGNHNEVAIPKPEQVPGPIRALVHRQAWRLAPGGGLDATIPMLADRLAGLAPGLAERRRARSTTQLASPAPECAPGLQRQVQRLRDEAARPVSSVAPASSSHDRSAIAMSEPTINFNNSGAVIHGQVGILHGSINYGMSATGSLSADEKEADAKPDKAAQSRGRDRDAEQ